MAMHFFLAGLFTVTPAFEEFGEQLPEVSLLQTKISIGALGSQDDPNDLVSVFQTEADVTTKRRPLHELSSEEQKKLLGEAHSRYSFFKEAPRNATESSGDSKHKEDALEESNEIPSESRPADDAAAENVPPTGQAPKNEEATTEGKASEESAAEGDASASETEGTGAGGHAEEKGKGKDASGTGVADEVAAEDAVAHDSLEDPAVEDAVEEAVDSAAVAPEGSEDSADVAVDVPDSAGGTSSSAASSVAVGASASATAVGPISSAVSSSVSAPTRPDLTSMLMANANAVLLLTLLAAACPQVAAGRGASAFVRYAAEFVGTVVLVFTVFCAVIVGDPTFGVLAIAFSLMVSIYALGHISGANFNPAVTIALWTSGKIASADVVPYVCVQLAASLVAALGATWLLWDMGSLSFGPAEGSTLLQAVAVEVFYTFLLCFCVLNVAASRRHGNKSQFYGLAIGFCVVTGGYGGGAISGGCFNPAVALGVASATPLTSALAANFAAYAGAQLLGAVIASLFFSILRPDDFQRDPVEEYSLVVKLLAEALGTFALVITVCLNVAAGSAAAPLSIGAALSVLVFSLGSVSGANFNPAVTLASWGTSRSSPCEAMAQAWFYVLVQLGSGIAAVAVCQAMFGFNAKLQPMQDHYGHACIGEGIFTFLLCFVVLSVARLSEYAGLAIGMCVTAGAVAIGPISGGCFNPAVSVALAIVSGDLTFLVGYVSSQVSGAMAAAILFEITNGHIELKSADHR